MEERERADSIPEKLLTNDLLSRASRICSPTSIPEADPKPAFASYRQSATTRPTTSARVAVPASISRTVGSCHRAKSFDIPRKLSEDAKSIAQNDSHRSQHPTINSLDLNSNSVVDVEPPRKYRLNKLSFSRDSHLWQTQDEPSLNQILEQERNAWLAQSPTDPDPRSQTPYSISHHSQPADHTTISDQACRSNQSSPARSPLKRTSCFQEGSMNEASRAVASTWNTSHPVYTPAHNRRYESTDLSDDEGTPRASAASRASTSSSIDINEFKPLPATPSTFRSTIKRIGQKVVNSRPAHTSEHVTAPPQSEKKQRRGLKKSMSTWKIFSNSTSDAEDTSNLTTDDESYGGKTKAYSSQTIKAKKSLINNGPSQKEVFDERKRKAEIAYNEQFGSARKRQKQVSTYNDHNDHVSDWDEPSYPTTSHGKGLRTLSSIRSMKSVLRKSAATPEMLANRDNNAVESSALPASDSHSTLRRHNRSQSHDSNRGLASDTDRLKKQSRNELEKENQRLRMMLRGKEAKKSALRNRRHSRDNSDNTTSLEQPSDGDIATQKSEEHDDKDIAADASREKEESEALDSSKFSNIPAATTHKSATVRRSQPEFVLPNDAPPIPPLPDNVQQCKALLPISGNTRPSGETATIKRRGPMCQQYDQAVLPRPLSMVLEGIEYVSDDEQTSKKHNAQLDGATDDENEVSKGCTGQVKSGHDPVTNSQRWDWPEDVF